MRDRITPACFPLLVRGLSESGEPGRTAPEIFTLGQNGGITFNPPGALPNKYRLRKLSGSLFGIWAYIPAYPKLGYESGSRCVPVHTCITVLWSLSPLRLCSLTVISRHTFFCLRPFGNESICAGRFRYVWAAPWIVIRSLLNGNCIVVWGRCVCPNQYV